MSIGIGMSADEMRELYAPDVARIREDEEREAAIQLLDLAEANNRDNARLRERPLIVTRGFYDRNVANLPPHARRGYVRDTDPGTPSD